MKDDSVLLLSGKKKSRRPRPAGRLLALLLIGAVGMLFLAYHHNDQSDIFLVPAKQKVMVVVAHPDDAVIIAGAYCHETVLKGGKVRVVFTTDGAASDDAAIGAIRRNEAYCAWALAGVPRDRIRLLRNDDYSGLQDPQTVSSVIFELADEINSFHPDVLFTSLYENGNYQHDVTNYIVSQAVALSGERPRIYEAPEYNFFVSFLRTPAKFLQAISRLIPFYEYHAWPQFIQDRAIYEFPLSREDRAWKERMLRQYKSQDVEWLLDHFVLRERFHALAIHDYCKPPFDYAGSTAYWINQGKKVPGIEPLLTRMFGRLQPVHPRVDSGTFSLESIASCSGI